MSSIVHRLARSTAPPLWAGLLAVVLIAALAGTALIGPTPADAQEAADEVVVIEVLGNRADLLSDGNALVEVTVPADADPATLAMTVDDRDVTEVFAVRENGRYMGVVEGLSVGEQVLTATLPDGRGARITLTNHPRGGPVFAGPQIQPWTCAEGAEDEQCTRETTYQLRYMPQDMTGFRDYDPENPPPDVATTTTSEGEEVPFIIRVENGTIDRDVYEIAVLYNPDEPDYEPWAPQRGYNGRMVITHGASCDTSYAMQDSSNGVEESGFLGAGFAVMSHALNNSGHNCNVVVQAESMIMTKEHFVENYGEIRWTIGTGCSGGALAQYWTANAYPGGIYQGITPACSFPDAGSSAMQYVDYDLLREYFEDPSRWGSLPDGNPIAWTPEKQAAVYGHPNAINAVTFTEVIPSSGDPSREANTAGQAGNLPGGQRCPGLPNEELYDAETNPDGVRCTLQAYNVNSLGVGEDGLAHRPFSNVGIQYGLNGLRDGTLSPAEFVDLNTKLGGWSADYDLQAERYDGAAEGFANLYRSGLNNTASNLDTVAIIDNRGPDPGAFHDSYRTYALQERLLREHGTADNMVVWRGAAPIMGDPTYIDDSVFAMDRWLAAVDADDSALGLDEKIITNRPEDLTPRCTTGSGVEAPQEFCDGVVDVYSTPRIEAGAPTTDDVQRCRLVPLSEIDYGDVTFTDEQLAALQATYPDGVCDYSRPSIGDRDTVGWLDYSTREGGVPMGPAPVSVPFGPGDRAIAQLSRIAGGNRIETAVEASMATFRTAETVVIASSADFADALAGAPLGAHEQAPVLLVGPTVLPDQTVEEIQRLDARHAVVLGGEAAIAPAVTDALTALGLTVERVAGPTRTETSVAVAQRMGVEDGVALAARDDFLGALAVSGLAAGQQIPILLVDGDDLGPAAAALRADTDILLIGSTDAVSDAVARQADEVGGQVTRLDGATPGALSTAIAREAMRRGVDPGTVWIATSGDYPDGLVAGAAAGRTDSLLLLVDGQDPAGAPETMALLAELEGTVSSVRIAGGVAAVQEAVQRALAQALAPPAD